MKQSFEKRTSGFTLIELLVVIAIIGLLSSVVFASLNSARGKARDAKRVGDIRQLERALELYFHDNNTYPPHASDTHVSTSLTVLVPTYIPSIPQDPTRGTTSSGYRYGRQSATAYTMLVQLESDTHTSWCGTSVGGGLASWSTATWYRDLSNPACRF